MPGEEGNRTTLYLYFPPECTDEHWGFTTYNTTVDEPLRECGPGPLGQGMEGGRCASFAVHDPDLRLHEGDSLRSIVIVTAGPGTSVTVVFQWHDEEGLLAERRDSPQFTPLPTSWGAGGGRNDFVVLERGSVGQLVFEVYVEGGPCDFVSTGDFADDSRFWVERNVTV